MSAVIDLIATHAEMLEENPYCYLELAYTRYTGYMAWLCTKPKDRPDCKSPADSFGTDRLVIASGQGDTAEEACLQVLVKLGKAKAPDDWPSDWNAP